MAYLILAMSNASGFHHIVYIVKLSYYIKSFWCCQACPRSVATSTFRGTDGAVTAHCQRGSAHWAPLKDYSQQVFTCLIDYIY